LLPLQNTLTIEGESGKGIEEVEEAGRRGFSSRIDLPKKLYNKLYDIDQIKAELKNGVLKVKVIVPKIKKEERNYAINVKVE
jgi:HSP20 family protein